MPMLRALLLLSVSAFPAAAQMNWLGPHLDAQQWHAHRLQTQPRAAAPGTEDRALDGARNRLPAGVSEQQSSGTPRGRAQSSRR